MPKRFLKFKKFIPIDADTDRSKYYLKKMLQAYPDFCHFPANTSYNIRNKSGKITRITLEHPLIKINLDCNLTDEEEKHLQKLLCSFPERLTKLKKNEFYFISAGNDKKNGCWIKLSNSIIRIDSNKFYILGKKLGAGYEAKVKDVPSMIKIGQNHKIIKTTSNTVVKIFSSQYQNYEEYDWYENIEKQQQIYNKFHSGVLNIKDNLIKTTAYKKKTNPNTSFAYSKAYFFMTKRSGCNLHTFKKKLADKDSVVTTLHLSSAICIIISALEQLKKLHNKNIVHGDICSANIMISETNPPVVHLIDFGYSTMLNNAISTNSKAISAGNNCEAITPNTWQNKIKLDIHNMGKTLKKFLHHVKNYQLLPQAHKIIKNLVDHKHYKQTAQLTLQSAITELRKLQGQINQEHNETATSKKGVT